MSCAFCEKDCDEFCHPPCAKEHYSREEGSICTICNKEIDIGGPNPHKSCVGNAPIGYPSV